MIAGVVSAGILVVGAGAAFADSSDDGGDYSSAPSHSSGGGSILGGLGGGLVSTDLVTGLVGGLGIL
ncbi:MAG TPA: hypothetical protein VGD73_21245 [Pseudonocardia sp.]|uniref:hypothetical protein n=1 Tax=Pseudonocardia sp. TaxID=60912 RepID=UPI002EDA6472